VRRESQRQRPQGNPFQPDLAFRGFTASPLLGTPQGLSVFQDGVRVNEPFGDIVNWDLIPQSAISSVQLIPGSNPSFGLNTLGGALAVYTKSGTQYPGGALELSGGSFGRRSAEFEWGGTRGPLDAFLTGNYIDDRGWAEHNPSVLRQLFAKVGWQDERTDLDAALTAVENDLEGLQTLPRSFLGDPRQPYTFPDRSSNQMTLITLKGSRFLTPAALLGGNAYYRQYRNRSLTSDVNSDYGQAGAGGAPDLVPALLDVAALDEDSCGGGVQLTLTTDAGRNRLTLGAAGDFGQARFTQRAQNATFSAGRETLGAGPLLAVTDADAGNRDLGVFAAAVLHPTAHLSASASGRYDRAQVSVSDESGSAPQLNGEHAFSRFNPALGLTYHPGTRLTLYAGYSEGMRVPTAIELSCANPGAPCRLPNDFISDPPLAAVIARTLEAGARGDSRGWQWSAAAYQSRLAHDIEFINSGAGNVGYFANIGSTQRAGLELSASHRSGALGISARYSLIDATFRAGFPQRSPDNSSADANGAIAVRRGDQLPGVPRQLFKLRIDYEFTRRASAGANLIASAGVYARGDENNADRNGRLPGYGLLDLDGRYRLSAAWQLFARIDNVFDTRYYDFGVLGENFFTGPDRSFGPPAGVAPRAGQFRGPGVPRGVWVGTRYVFGSDSARRGGED
jgi:outer membrane receptor protein involved in Fe transport